MSERIDRAATHVASRGLEDAWRHAIERLTDEERAKVAELGLTRDALLVEAVDSLDALSVASGIATEALSKPGTEDKDPIATVVPFAAECHPYDEAMLKLVRSKIETAA